MSPPFRAIHGATFCRFEQFPDLSTYACQIWSRSDGRVKKESGLKSRLVQTDKGMPLPIVDSIVLYSGCKRCRTVVTEFLCLGGSGLWLG